MKCSGVAIPKNLLARIPLALRNRACICQECVKAFWREQNATGPQKIHATDYYLDDEGLMVFTAAFHLRRGYCCGNNCRHCPYRTQK